MRVLDAILLFSREYLDIFFLLICLFFVEPFPNLEPLPNPLLKERERLPKKPRTTGNRAGLDCYSISRKRGVTC